MFNRSFELDKLCAAESFDDGEICICLLEVLTLGTFKKNRENGSSWKKNDTSKFPVGVLIVIMLLNSVRVPQE